MGAGIRHCKPGGSVFVYLPKCVTTATCPSGTIMKPLASHSTTATATPRPTNFGEPLGSWTPGPPDPPPPPPPKGLLPPRRGLRPNMEPKRLLKSRHTSSRSGGPSPRSGRLGGSEPPWFWFPRPQPGSFKLNILDIKRTISRVLTRLDNCLPKIIQAYTIFSAHIGSGNRTMFVTFQTRFMAGQVDFVVDQNKWNILCTDVGQNFVNFIDVLVALWTGRIHNVQQQVNAYGFFKCRTKCRNQRRGKVANEADGIGHHHLPRALNPNPSGSGIKGGKQLVGCVGLGTCQGIEQGGFARVGIPHQ